MHVHGTGYCCRVRALTCVPKVYFFSGLGWGLSLCSLYDLLFAKDSRNCFPRNFSNPSCTRGQPTEHGLSEGRKSPLPKSPPSCTRRRTVAALLIPRVAGPMTHEEAPVMAMAAQTSNRIYVGERWSRNASRAVAKADKEAGVQSGCFGGSVWRPTPIASACCSTKRVQ